MEIDEVLRSKEYREGWEVYDYHRRNGRYPDQAKGGLNPYGTCTNSSASSGPILTAADCWIAGAHSAYGTSSWRGITKRTPPITKPVSVQLRLFEVES